MTGMLRPWARGTRAVLAGLVLASMGTLAGLFGGAASAASATGAQTATGPRTVMILLDTDWSMAGVVTAERTVALGYARALPPDVRVGLITFGTYWHLVLPPTSDRSRLPAALRANRLSGGTSKGIYGAMSAAASAVDRQHAAAGSRLLVISDAEFLVARSPGLTLPVDVVPWRIDRDDRTPALRALASASGGRVAAPADAGMLAAAFASFASHAPATAQPAPESPMRGSLFAVLALVFMALFMVALLAIGSMGHRDQGRDLADSIERYGPRHAPAPADSEGKVTRATGLTTRLLQSTNSEKGLAERLDLAGSAREPAEWALLGISVCALAAAALAFATGNLLIGVLGGSLIGWLGMRLALSFRIGRRRAAFSDQLPDVLQLIAGSLQSGFSLPQAVDAVVREGSQPAAGEFSRALAEARVGADLEDALRRVASRMDSTDLRWTVMAIRIQREVGGNLAEVLRTTVGTMRERAFMRRQVRALSAEGRLSAYILIALPVLVGAWFFYSDPSYMRPLYTTLIGLLMLIGSGVLIVIGALWMRKLIKIEV